jgi:tetratricopeptide (TPR) repeat protein
LAGLFFLDPAAGQEEVVAYVSPREPANEYLDELDLIEAEYGPYATELSDLYLGLGQTLMSRGDYEQARDAFHRGVMVVRVNSGPNSPEQTNHLYLLASLENLLGELKAVDELLHNIYFISSSYYGEDSPEMLPVLERMYQWYLVTRPISQEDSEYEDYERTIELTKEMARVSEVAKGKNHSNSAVAYQRFGEAQFQMVRHLTGLGMTLTPDMYAITTTGNWHPWSVRSDPVVKHYRAGSRAYRNYLESMQANESTTPPEYAEALADLGDWHLVFENTRKSRRFYQQGHQILAQSEAYAELADGFMGHPKPMHFIDNLQPGFLEGVQTEPREMSLEISMTVTNRGSVRSVEVLNAPEDMSEHDIRAIKKQVGGIPFRPAMKEGEVITTKDFIWHYVITLPGEAT